MKIIEKHAIFIFTVEKFLLQFFFAQKGFSLLYSGNH